MGYWLNVKMELDFSKILFLMGILSFGLYFFVKKWRNRLTKVMIGTFGICLVLNLYALTEYYKITKIQNTIAEYSELKTCNEMKNRFSTDLKKGEIKYFQFGIGANLELQKTLKTKYEIECFAMGCLVQSELDCYNDLVNNYLKEKFKDRIVDY
jgi:hypothetical protein